MKNIIENHNPCLFENKHFGAWEEIKGVFPYSLFLNTMNSMLSTTKQENHWDYIEKE